MRLIDPATPPMPASSTLSNRVSPMRCAGLESIASRYDVLLMDQWGLLHNGKRAFEPAVECLRRLTDLGKTVVIVSNSGRRAADNVAKLAALGIDDGCYAAIVTSGELAHLALLARSAPFGPRLGKRCLLWTSDDDSAILDHTDCQRVRDVDQGDFIVLAGVEDGVSLAEYAERLRPALRRRLPLICINPDHWRYSPNGMTFSAGEVARAYQAAGGLTHFIGKPYPGIYDWCRRTVADFDPRRTLAVGDSLFHDIGGGSAAGLDTLFVTDGIHAADFSESRDDAQRIAMMRAIVSGDELLPTWFMDQLAWATTSERLVVPLERVRHGDVARVGGKNASLGEMIGELADQGVRVPGGFATTADAYREFLEHDGLANRIEAELAGLDVADVAALMAAGAKIREWIMAAPLPADLEQAIRAEYQRCVADDGDIVSFAVRSSATAEDLPDASFAGQQETFLNIAGIDAVLGAIKEVFASLYNDRAIAYRVHHGYAHADVALSVGVQRMVRSDLASSGVMFTLDTESGFRNVVLITASYGLGESVVQGAVNPDEYVVYKPLLAAGKPAIIRRTLGTKLSQMVFGEVAEAGRATAIVPVTEQDSARFCLCDDDVLELARYATIIERHYGRPMDIEWGKDGRDGRIFILQARPETVKSRQALGRERFRLNGSGPVLTTGRAVTQKIAVGKVRVVRQIEEMSLVEPGDVLVADMTDPNWEPVMKRAAALVTNRGGRTCHAAIIARELGIPAIVGCGDATEVLNDGDLVTVTCAAGETGVVYDGCLEFSVERDEPADLPALPVKMMLNVGNPERAFGFADLPNSGVGLARLEFVINTAIGIHPKAILEPERLTDELREQIADRAKGYESPRQFFVDKLAEGVATIAAAFYPKPVIVRLSDFKSNEYRKLLGGALFEPEEENPMLGFRGAARYLADDFRECFALECEAMRKVREQLGFTNVELMIPFVRTVAEASGVVERLAEFGLRRGERGLRLIMMCEIPANALLADEFLDFFDGFSIGSNDMTQLTLGMDRDSGLMAQGFDERDPAVKVLLGLAIKACKRRGKYVGICGQGPSDHADFAEWLVAEGIESMSLNPDSVVGTWQRLAAAMAPPLVANRKPPIEREKTERESRVSANA